MLSFSCVCFLPQLLFSHLLLICTFVFPLLFKKHLSSLFFFSFFRLFHLGTWAFSSPCDVLHLLCVFVSHTPSLPSAQTPLCLPSSFHPCALNLVLRDCLCFPAPSLYITLTMLPLATGSIPKGWTGSNAAQFVT